MKVAGFILTIAIMNFASPAFSSQTVAPTDQPTMNMKLTLEDREKMATAHEQMAVCLRTELDFSTCHDALHTECKAMMGDSCPGMEMAGKSRQKGMKNKK